MNKNGSCAYLAWLPFYLEITQMYVRDLIRDAIISRDLHQCRILHDMEGEILKARLKNYESIVSANELLGIELRKVESDLNVDNSDKKTRIALLGRVHQQRIREAGLVLDVEISRATQRYEDARRA